MGSAEQLVQASSSQIVVRKSECMNVCTCIPMYVRMYVRIWVYLCIWVYVCMYNITFVCDLYVHYVRIRIRIPICVWMCIRMYVCMCVY